ncbi:MAG: DUF5131 family protein [Clostridiales bacterium]|nr:DUF5131 family protein [Candidatus Apopatocola equi]
MSSFSENSWNPWHGCTKISPGCKFCYVYRQDARYGSAVESSLCRKTASFRLPLQIRRTGEYKLAPGSVIYTCFTSDFLLEDADIWRAECWEMMRFRSDLFFYFFTKRIDRLEQCLPPDWGNGYENVIIGCTVENQDRSDYRLPIFKALPIRHKTVIVAPMIGPVDLSPYLDESIEEVSVSGESGVDVRPLYYDWVLDLRAQCMEAGVPFIFHQTGATLIKDGKRYSIPRREQIAQARKAGIDYPARTDSAPDKGNIELY